MNGAVFKVSSGIIVEPVPDSSVIRITYQNQDPTLVQPILNEIIDAYFAKHAQLHQGLGVSPTFLTNEIVRLSSELVQTDDELSKIKNAAGIVSPDDTQKGYADQISKIRQNIFSAEADLAERQAMLGELTKSPATKVGRQTFHRTGPPPEQVAKYKDFSALLIYFKEENRTI